MCLGAVDLIVWMKRRFPIETPPSLLFFAFCFTTCPDKHQYNDESKISPCSVFNQRGTKEAPFHYMTVINGCTALNELQADRGTRKCTQKASQTTHSDRHTHTHTILSFNEPHLHADQCFSGATMRCSTGMSCSFSCFNLL